MDIKDDFLEIYELILYAHTLFDSGCSKSELKSVKKELQKILDNMIKTYFIESENEKKLYEKNSFGIVTEYLSLGIPEDDRHDFTPEITDLEERVYELEKQIKILGGVVNVY